MTREIGRYLGQGMAQGMHESREDVRRAAAAIAGSALPNTGGRGRGGSLADATIDVGGIHGVSDLVAAAVALERRPLMVAG